VTDHRELLELAARAAGYQIDFTDWRDCGGWTDYRQIPGGYWNPLVNDGDALRLAVKLCGHGFAMVDLDIPIIQARIDGADMQSAARLAIVKAAAEIGKGMLG